MGETSLAQIEAVRRYEEKNYKKIMFQLRQEDAEIIKAIDEAKEHGITKREWLSDLFYAKPQLHDGLVPLEDIEEVLISLHTDNWEMIVDELKKGI